MARHADIHQAGVLPQSEETVRHSQASLSVVAAFQAEGFSDPPPGLAAIITGHVRSFTRGIPVNELASMTPGSGALGTAASAGVSMLLASLTPQQREAMRAGMPIDPVSMQQVADGLRRGLSLASIAALDRSGARFDEFSGGGRITAAMMAARDLALRTPGMAWAAGHPDLLRLGSAAIESLAAVQFRRETFERSIRNGYRARDVVGLVDYARDTGRDARAVANGANDAVEILGRHSAAERAEWRRLYQDLGQARTPEQRQAAERALVDRYTQHAGQHPEDREVVVRNLRSIGATTEAENIAATTTTHADNRVANADAERAARERAEREARERAAEEERALFGDPGANTTGPGQSAVSSNPSGGTRPAVVTRPAPEGTAAAASPPPQQPQRVAQLSLTE